jgi:hypothetical protein
MSSLTRFDSNDLELFINSNGECFASIRGMARMVGVNDGTIKRFLTASQITVKRAEVPTIKGLRTADLLDEDAILEAIVKYKPELFKQFAKLGLRFYLHSVVGFKTQTQPKFNIYAHRVEIASKWNIPDGHWCVFHEISLMANAVGKDYNVQQYDLLDGSVGICWSKYRKDKEWALDTVQFPIFFEDKRDLARVNINGYADAELPQFRSWLRYTYKIEKLPKYLEKKYGALVKV